MRLVKERGRNGDEERQKELEQKLLQLEDLKTRQDRQKTQLKLQKQQLESEEMQLREGLVKIRSVRTQLLELKCATEGRQNQISEVGNQIQNYLEQLSKYAKTERLRSIEENYREENRRNELETKQKWKEDILLSGS